MYHVRYKKYKLYLWKAGLGLRMKQSWQVAESPRVTVRESSVIRVPANVSVFALVN